MEVNKKMFKKRQTRNFRRKQSDDEDDRNGNGDVRSDSESRGSSGIMSNVKESKKDEIINPPKPVPSTSSLLSFGDDEDEEVFQVRKSAASRNLERNRHRVRATKDAVVDEKPTSKRAEEPIGRTLEQFSIQEKTTKQKSRSPSPIVIDGEDAEEDDNHEEPIMGKFKEVLKAGAIPDANLIHIARKQRQMAREMGSSEVPGSYIPIKKVDDTQKYKKEQSRLIREDDDNENSDSGEEGGQFYSKLRDEEEEERRQVESDFLRVEQGDSDEEKDDELERWESEQIRKGVSRNQISYFAQDYLASTYGNTGQVYPSYAYGNVLPGSGANYAEYAATTASFKEIREIQPMEIDMDLSVDDEDEGLQSQRRPSTLPKIGGSMVSSEDSVGSLRDVKAKLEQRRTEFEAACRTRKLDQEKMHIFLEENETACIKLDESIPQLRDQYRFYQEMKTYVRDLLDCFNEKVPLIEKLETRMLELWVGRSQFLIKRRQQDTKDQYDECSAAALGKSQILQKDSDRAIHAADREARRTRRRQGREKTLASIGHHEGMSSDDEEAPSRIANFSTEKERITREASDIFKDTLEEFYSAEDIVQRFMDWRKLYKDAFDQAFIIHCLPKLLAPLIRWQMLTWNPTEVGSTPLKSMDWYKKLQAVEESHRDSSDGNEFELVLPACSGTLFLRMKDIVEYVWDPTSTSQTSNLVAFMTGILRSHPGSDKNKNLGALKDAIRNRIKRSFDDDLFTPIYSKEVLDNKTNGASLFLDRQFWFSIKVLQNIVAWSGVFSDKTVQELVFDGIVNRHVVLALQCGGAPDSATLTKCKAVCSTLPSTWLSRLKEKETLSQLDPLCKVLVRIADEFNDSKIMDKTTIREATKEIHRLLVKLHGWKYVDMIGQKYKIK